MIITTELQSITVTEEVSSVAGPTSGDIEDIRLTLNGDGVAYARLLNDIRREFPAGCGDSRERGQSIGNWCRKSLYRRT